MLRNSFFGLQPSLKLILIVTALFACAPTENVCADDLSDQLKLDRAMLVTSIDAKVHESERDSLTDLGTIATLFDMIHINDQAKEYGYTLSPEDYYGFAAEMFRSYQLQAPEIRSLRQRGIATTLDGILDVGLGAVGSGSLAASPKGNLLVSGVKAGWTAAREKILFELELDNRSFYQNEMWAFKRQTTSQVDDIIQVFSEFCREGQNLTDSDQAMCMVGADLMKMQFGVDFYNSGDEIQAEYPGGFPENVPRDENGKVDLAALLKQTNGKAQKLLSDTEAIIKLIKAQAPNGTVDAAKKQELLDQKQQYVELQRRSDAHGLQAKTFRTGLTLAGQLFNAFNFKEGKEIVTAGGAALQIWESVDAFRITSDALALRKASAFEKFSNGLDMVSGITGGVLTVVSMFKKSKSSPEQAIMKYLAILGQMFQTLRNEMHERFDRVDQGINQIIETLADNFFKIDFGLGIIRGDIGQIQGSILAVHTQLDRLTRYFLEWQLASSKDDFLDAVDDCLGYRKRTGQDMTQEKFNQCELAFYGWAFRNSTDQIWSGPLSREYDDSGLIEAMNDFPLSVNINYFSRYPERSFGLHNLSFSTLANPVEWQNGAQAYINLISAWPALARNLPGVDDRRKTILSLGLELRDSLQSIISTKDENGSPQSSSDIFDALFAKYKFTLLSLDQAIKQLEQFYVIENMRMVPNTDDFFDPWKNADNQSTKWRPSIDTIANTLWNNVQLGLPEGAILSYLPQIYFVAGRLGWGSFDVVVNGVTWENVRKLPLAQPSNLEAETFQNNFGSQVRGNVLAMSGGSSAEIDFAVAEDGYYRVGLYGALEREGPFNSITASIEIRPKHIGRPQDPPTFGSVILKTQNYFSSSTFRNASLGVTHFDKGTYRLNLDAQTAGGIGRGSVLLADRIELQQEMGPSSCIFDGESIGAFNPSRCEILITGTAGRFFPTEPAVGNLVVELGVRYNGTQILAATNKFRTLHSVLGIAPTGGDTISEFDIGANVVATNNWNATQKCYVRDPRTLPRDPIEIEVCAPPLNIRRNFLSNATISTPYSEGAVHAEMANRLNGILKTHRLNIFASLKERLKTGNLVQESGDLLAAIRSMIEGYIVLGLPYTISERELARALLYGPDKLIDRTLLISMYTSAESQASDATRPDPIAEGLKRAELLEDLIKKEVDYYGAKSPIEVMPGIVDTINDLQAVTGMLTDTQISILGPKSVAKFKVTKLKGRKKFSRGDKNSFDVLLRVILNQDASETIKNKKQLADLIGLAIVTKSGCRLKTKISEVKGKFPKTITAKDTLELIYSVQPGKCAGKVSKTKKEVKIPLSYSYIQ